MQPDALAQLGEADAVAVARDLFHDCKAAADRLHAAARRRGALAAEVADIGDAGPLWLAGRRFLFRSRSHLAGPPLQADVITPFF